MGRPQSHVKDAVGRTDRLAKLSGGSSPLNTLKTGSKGMKKISKFSSHTGVLDKRPKITKGSNMDVSDLLSSLTPKASSTPEAPKRGDLKRKVALDTLMAQHTSEIGALLTPPTSSSTSGPKKSRGGRNQVLLEQGQAYASVAALNGASSMESTSTSFSQPSIDPFALINAHLTTVINSAPPAAPGPAFVRPAKPVSHKPANAAHYKHAPKPNKNTRTSSNPKRR